MFQRIMFKDVQNARAATNKVRRVDPTRVAKTKEFWKTYKIYKDQGYNHERALNAAKKIHDGFDPSKQHSGFIPQGGSS